MFVLTLFSTKGGPGKSTTAANLSGLLADLGLSVLGIDADEQPTFSRYFPIIKEAPKGLEEFLFHSDELSEDLISNTAIENLDIICSNNIGSEIRHKLLELPYYTSIFRHNLQHPVFSKYDIVVIDTQGAVGPLQTSAAYASDILLSPVRPEVLSAREFLSGTREILRKLDRGMISGLARPPLYAFINALDRTRDSRFTKDMITEAIAEFDVTERVKLLNTIIPQSKAYPEAASERIPVHRHEFERKGKKSESAYETMLGLIYEIFPSIEAANLKVTQED